MSALGRWRAAGLHLALSAVVAVAVTALMLGLWYPRPLFEAQGGNELVMILVGVDVVAGPFLTLLVFKAGKPGLKFDLAAIALTQLAALAYGVHVVALARPAYLVFVLDRLEIVTAAELGDELLAEARYPEFRAAPWTGPRLAAADLPADPAEREQLIRLSAVGLDAQNFPRYYVPYGARRAAVLAKAQTVAAFRADEPATARIVDGYLADTGTPEDAVRVLLLRTRLAWVAVLVDPASALPVKMLLGERFH